MKVVFGVGAERDGKHGVEAAGGGGEVGVAQRDVGRRRRGSAASTNAADEQAEDADEHRDQQPPHLLDGVDREAQADLQADQGERELADARAGRRSPRRRGRARRRRTSGRAACPRGRWRGARAAPRWVRSRRSAASRWHWPIRARHGPPAPSPPAPNAAITSGVEQDHDEHADVLHERDEPVVGAEVAGHAHDPRRAAGDHPERRRRPVELGEAGEQPAHRDAQPERGRAHDQRPAARRAPSAFSASVCR